MKEMPNGRLEKNISASIEAQKNLLADYAGMVVLPQMLSIS